MARIAIDAMGSDNGSKMVVASVKKYKMDHPETIFYVCGREEELQELKGIAEIVDARDVMGMEDGALAVMRNRNTSMYKACDLVANGTCEGVVSAGSTGAFLTCATIRLKMIEGIHRACLCTTFPTSDGKGVTILDIGANNENQPEHLVQFAKIGEVYSKKVRKIEEPNIYLIVTVAPLYPL
jgi:glycerol-3-phosphate acyltransferase PlsX